MALRTHANPGLPRLLYFMGLPNSGFSKERQILLTGNETALGTNEPEEIPGRAQRLWKGPKMKMARPCGCSKPSRGSRFERDLPRRRRTQTGTDLGSGKPRRFNELNDAALNEGKRKYMEGETVILEGRFKRLADKEFSLFRMKMTCCAADTVPLKVRIVVPQALSNFSDFDWVTVKGQLQFLQVQGQDRYIPVIMVANNNDVAKTQPKNEYEQ